MCQQCYIIAIEHGADMTFTVPKVSRSSVIEQIHDLSSLLRLLDGVAD